MKILYSIALLGILAACTTYTEQTDVIDMKVDVPEATGTSIIILGNIQDAGSPHIGCKKACCADLIDSLTDRRVTCLGLYDAENNKHYLFEASPDMPRQLKLLKQFGEPTNNEMPDGIFLTHAHIGHYTGLMYLGKEAINASEVPVYAMPRMKEFLENNGPWSQLVAMRNIVVHPLQNEQSELLSAEIKVIPILVPHRDEYSETVGYKIVGPNKSLLFIPDIDKWEKWDKDIIKEIKQVDYAVLDATFYSGEEIDHRDIKEIPHPFIIESFEKFGKLPAEERKKIYFIHFNHTNPVIDPNSAASQEILKRGFNVARQGDVIEL